MWVNFPRSSPKFGLSPHEGPTPLELREGANWFRAGDGIHADYSATPFAVPPAPPLYPIGLSRISSFSPRDRSGGDTGRCPIALRYRTENPAERDSARSRDSAIGLGCLLSQRVATPHGQEGWSPWERTQSGSVSLPRGDVSTVGKPSNEERCLAKESPLIPGVGSPGTPMRARAEAPWVSMGWASSEWRGQAPTYHQPHTRPTGPAPRLTRRPRRDDVGVLGPAHQTGEHRPELAMRTSGGVLQPL